MGSTHQAPVYVVDQAVDKVCVCSSSSDPFVVYTILFVMSVLFHDIMLLNLLSH